MLSPVMPNVIEKSERVVVVHGLAVRSKVHLFYRLNILC